MFGEFPIGEFEVQYSEANPSGYSSGLFEAVTLQQRELGIEQYQPDGHSTVPDEFFLRLGP
ncbi:hypothetical protein DRQ53_13190 [bacterium]|nr:MAG: hypothetical protein DRQ53_13190 [bacterium]